MLASSTAPGSVRMLGDARISLTGSAAATPGCQGPQKSHHARRRESRREQSTSRRTPLRSARVIVDEDVLVQEIAVDEVSAFWTVHDERTDTRFRCSKESVEERIPSQARTPAVHVRVRVVDKSGNEPISPTELVIPRNLVPQHRVLPMGCSLKCHQEPPQRASERCREMGRRVFQEAPEVTRRDRERSPSRLANSVHDGNRKVRAAEEGCPGDPPRTKRPQCRTGPRASVPRRDTPRARPCPAPEGLQFFDRRPVVRLQEGDDGIGVRSLGDHEPY